MLAAADAVARSTVARPAGWPACMCVSLLRVRRSAPFVVSCATRS